MSRFEPHILSTEPAGAPDLLAGAALRSLTREIPVRPDWGPVQAALLASLTFGVAPLLVWARAFRSIATLERQQAWHLSEWVRLRSGHPDGHRLTRLAERIRHRPALRLASAGCLVLVAAGFALYGRRYGFDFADLRASTYGYGYVDPLHLPNAGAQNLFVVWTAGLSLAYFFHWLQVQLHLADVRRFVRTFNEVAGGELIDPVEVRPVGLGVRPLWAIAAAVLVAFGAVWAIPMTLAGVVHVRWRREGRRVRGGLADQLRQMLLMRRPAMRIPRLPNFGSYCRNELCRGPVPPLARFCPRCGTSAAARGVARGVGRVA